MTRSLEKPMQEDTSVVLARDKLRERQGWEVGSENKHDDTSVVETQSGDKTLSWDDLAKETFRSGEAELSSIENKYEKERQQLAETFLDFSNLLKITFEAVEDEVEYVFEINNRDKRLSKKIIDNLRSISSIAPTEEDENIWRYSINDTIFIDVNKTTGDIDSVNKLTSFEMRSLAQGKESSVPFSREGLSDFRPKTDLHTHFAGALTPDSLIEAGQKHDLGYPISYLKRAGIDVDKYEADENGNVKLNFLSDDDIDILKDGLMISPVTQQTFNKMEEIYDLRGPFTKNKALFPDLLHSLAEGYQRDGVEYVELSYSSFIEDRDYMQMINENIPQIEAETGVRLRFVAGLWRHSDKEWNMDDADRIKQISKSPYIVGCDFMGHETNSTMEFADELRMLADHAMLNDPDFTIRVHAGENPMYEDNVKDTLSVIYEQHRQREERDGREYPMPVVRIGHGLYGVDDETIELAKEMGAIVEFNISSNLALNNINSITEIPIKKYLDAGVDVVLGTDGGGIYSTMNEQEALLASAAGLTPEDFEKIRKTEMKVREREARRSVAHPVPEVDELYGRVRYSTDDGQQRYNQSVAERYVNERKAAVVMLNERLSGDDIITNPEEVERDTVGKVPVMITGASKNNWPNIALEDQRKIAVTMQALVDVLNPDTAYIVTGGTNFGVEKTMHEAIRRHNSQDTEKPMVLLGTLTMEATHEKNAGVDQNTITHAVILEHDGRPVANWMDLPDTQLEYVKERNGYMIAVGGGGVVSDMIQRGYNLDVNMQLMDGPYGASTNKSRALAGNDYSFRTPEDLIRRLYAANPKIFSEDFSLDDIEEVVRRATEEVDGRY